MNTAQHTDRQNFKSSAHFVESAFCMTLGFAVLFFGVGAVQQYIVVCFQEKGMASAGKFTLLLVYLCYFVGSFQAHRVVQILGPRLCMIATSISYALLILCVWSGSVQFSYFSAVLSGFSASLLWTGQNVVVNRIPDKDSQSMVVSDFWIRYSLGTGLGTLILGLLVGAYSYGIPLLYYSFICLSSMVLFMKMPKDFAGRDFQLKTNPLPSFHRLTVLSGVTVFFVRFVYGLIISQLPRIGLTFWNRVFEY